MKNLLIWSVNCLLLLAGALVHAADQRQEIDEIRQVSPNERIAINVMRGEVTITPSDSGEFSVSGLLDELAEGYELRSNNGFTRFEVEMPRNINVRRNRQGSDLQITVPVGSSVEYRSVSGALHISGISGGVKLHSVNGDIEATGLSDAVEISTVNGGIRSSGNSGRISLGTVNGEIVDRQSRGRLRISAINGVIRTESTPAEAELTVVNGRISANLHGTTDLKLSSVNGNVALILTGSPSPRITGSTVSGGIELSVDTDTSAHFSLRNSAGGRISNALTEDEPVRDTYGPARRLQFKTGQGAGAVELTSVSGRLELRAN